MIFRVRKPGLQDLFAFVPKVCAGHARAYAIATLHRVEDCLGS
jgi:hypothetical protein